MEDPPEFGTLTVAAKESQFSVSCDALAVTGTQSRERIMLVSAIGPATTIKSVRAALCNSRSVLVTARQCGDCSPRRENYYCTDAESGYRCKAVKLGYDLWHLVAISESPHLLPVYSVRSLLAKLQSQQFTTPILPGWASWITRRLKEERVLREIPSFGCRAALLTVADEGLDKIVSAGVRQGHIHISREATTCK